MFTGMEKSSVKKHLNDMAEKYDYWKNKNWYYYDNIKNYIKANVHPSARVLEIGCATGDILAYTEPRHGIGIDISDGMIDIARKKHPHLNFYSTSIEDVDLDETFDYIIMVDILDHVYDIMDVFISLEKFCHPTTKIILTTISPWWEPILALTEKLGMKMPEGLHNCVDIRAIKNILAQLNFEVSHSGYMLLCPKYVPGLSYLMNTIGVRTFGLKRLSPVQTMIVRPMQPTTTDLNLGCSVVIPCHNEEDNIQDAIRRVPQMGQGTEVIVVNDGSTDHTVQKVNEIIREFPHVKLVDYSPNRGKGQAVREGFKAATKEVLMILDADLSVDPEELPRFFAPLNKGLCQFVNGSRMVYPMESQAMRTLNLFGNKIFSQIMTFLLNQAVTDTLCGTKAFYRADYQHMSLTFDKWGDYDFLFGAARMGSKILEVPVHYKDRLGGESKMKTFRHGFHLLCACFQGFKYLVMTPPSKVKKSNDR